MALRRLITKGVIPVCQVAPLSTSADGSTNLKEVLSKKIPAHNAKVKSFRAEHGNTVVQSVNIDMVISYKIESLVNDECFITDLRRNEKYEGNGH